MEGSPVESKNQGGVAWDLIPPAGEGAGAVHGKAEPKFVLTEEDWE